MNAQDKLPYYNELFALTHAILKCREDIVDDVIQETYIEIYEKYKMPLELFSKEAIVNILEKRCKVAYSEMMKSPSKPLRAIKTEAGNLDPDLFFELAAYRTAVYQHHNFEVNFKEVLGEKDWIELYGLQEKQQISEAEPQKEEIRFSNKFIFEQVRHLWKKKRTKYLDTLIDNAANFKTKAAENNHLFIEYLISKRWSGTPTCSNCGSTLFYKTRRGYKCRNRVCQRKYSEFTGCLFENTKIPLAVWFTTIKSYIASDCNKLNTRFSGKMNGITQKSMWYNLQKIYENVIKISDNEFSINGIKNTFLISEIDELLTVLSVDIVEFPTMKDYYRGRKIIATDGVGKDVSFDSIQVAGRELNLDFRRISECINGKRSNYEGYKFILA